jgi:IMP dehydrogenase
VVDRPFVLARSASIREARELARRHNVTGLLIEEAPGSGVLAGLLSNRDLPWSASVDDHPVEEFMTPIARLVTGPPDVSIEEAERRMFAHRVEKLPLVDGDRRIRGLITKKDILAARQRPYLSKDARGRLLVGAAVGARGDFLERAAELLGAGADVLLIDIAHGHSEVMRRAVEAVRARFGGVDLVCGNVATAEGAEFLRDLGADRDRRRSATAPSDPRGVVRRGGPGANHRRWRGARGQGSLPRPRGRRLGRDAG